MLKIGDVVWYTDGADDRHYTITGFCLDDLRRVTMVELDGYGTHFPWHCADPDQLTDQARA